MLSVQKTVILSGVEFPFLNCWLPLIPKEGGAVGIWILGGNFPSSALRNSRKDL